MPICIQKHNRLPPPAKSDACEEKRFFASTISEWNSKMRGARQKLKIGRKVKPKKESVV
jgi:hypothetical protein